MVAGGMGTKSDRSRPGAPAPSPRPDRSPRLLRLPAVGCDRHVQPPADGLVDDAAGSWLPGGGDVAEDGERCLGDCVPDLLAGQSAGSGPLFRFVGYVFVDIAGPP